MNNQKTPLSRTLSAFTQGKARDEIAKLGKALPGHVVSVSGPIVTVAFDVDGVTLPQVTMPLFGPEYIRYPIQAGDKGVCFPVDVYIGGVSGLGIGTADATMQGNLSALVWFPIGNKHWTAARDPDAVEIYGPNGVILKDENGDTVATLTPSGLNIAAQSTFQVTAGTSITLQVGSVSIVINSSGVSIQGKEFLTHMHTLVQSGSSDSGPVA